MKKKNFFLIFFLVFSFLFNSFLVCFENSCVKANWVAGSTTILIDSLKAYSDIGLNVSKIDDPVIYEKECMVEGNLPFIVKFNNINSFSVNEKSSLLSSFFLNNKGFDDLYSKYYILVSYQKVVVVPIYINKTTFVNYSFYNNETRKNDSKFKAITKSVFDHYDNFTELRYKWVETKNLNSLVVDKNGYMVINVKTFFKAGLGKKVVDVVPVLTINGVSNTYNNYVWYNSSWLYYIPLKFDDKQILGTLSNFPILVNITSTSLKNHAQSDGDDICFISKTNTTKFNHEIEWYNSSTGRLVAWVNITSFNTTSNNVIYMYYGNAGCSNQQNVVSTWNTGYYAVYHMKTDANADLIDSTTNSNTAPNYVATLTQYTLSTRLGYQIYFPGGDPNAPNFRTPAEIISQKDLSTTVFIFSSDTTVTYPHVVTYHYGNQIVVARVVSPNFNSYIVDSADTPSVNYGTANANTYALSERIVEGDKMYVYQNGLFKASTTIATIDRALTMGNYIGCMYKDGVGEGRYGYKGYIDELKISWIDRSANWIITEQNNYLNSTDGGFYIIGVEVAYSPPWTNYLPFFKGEHPSNNSVDIMIYTVCGGTVYDYNSNHTLNVTFASNYSDSITWINYQTNSSLSNNSKVNWTFSGAKYQLTFYWWRVYVHDGFANRTFTFKFKTCQDDFIDPLINFRNETDFTYSFKFSVNISDNFGLFDVKLWCTNGIIKYFNSSHNGTFWLNLTGLYFNTSYSIYVNVSDNVKNWVNNTYTLNYTLITNESIIKSMLNYFNLLPICLIIIILITINIKFRKKKV